MAQRSRSRSRSPRLESGSTLSRLLHSRQESPAADHTQVSSVAVSHAECPISFEPLHAGNVGVFVGRDKKRVSPHFFRYESALQWIESSKGASSRPPTCPLTRCYIHEVLLVPSILEDPHGWFKACDVDGDGRLSRDEIVEALKAQLPLDTAKVERLVRDNDADAWASWDADGSGFVEYNEIIRQDGGLLSFAQRTLQRLDKGAEMPDIRHDRLAWYRYWDDDGSESLELEEVVRAFAKTFGMDVSTIIHLRASLQAVWPVFDTDNSGSISFEEFMKPREGLADTIIATMGLLPPQ
eukprot:TRINITY_DN50952_c0_g1_i1.p1 TRINITY_DN50952_c0_g1~~TRINITY_DN50952_c0_g1_i1.p1  ORF type:complete len:341 (+),score=63.70 TRINITY_DN50952_c0_g1_i1:137-1024(+)